MRRLKCLFSPRTFLTFLAELQLNEHKMYHCYKLSFTLWCIFSWKTMNCPQQFPDWLYLTHVCWWYDWNICHRPHPLIIYFNSEHLLPASLSVIPYLSKCPYLNTISHSIAIDLSTWSDKRTISPVFCQTAGVDQTFWARRTFHRFGRVSGVVRSEVNTGARGSSKKTGTEFTWSCESDATTSLGIRYWFPLSGWETLRSRIVDIQLTCLAVLLASYLFTLGPALTWVRHCVTQLCDFQQNYFKPSCSLLLGGCFMWGWGSEQWYEIPGFAEQPIWS